jgi:superfamily II DNA/RNA helicase
MSFQNFSLAPEILQAVRKSGYNNPTSIQLKAIPAILQKQDLLASSQTGSGKTAAFLLPLLHLLSESKRDKKPRALILAPTRELAMQIHNQAKKYSAFLPHIKSQCIGGGTPIMKQIRDLQKPYDLLIATPGRLIDLIQRKKISLSSVELLVLDEADRMLDMGFMPDVKKIVKLTPSDRQTLFFSATLKGEVHKLARLMLHDPVDISIEGTETSTSHIKQSFLYASHLSQKNDLLDQFLSDAENLENAVIFTSTKHHAEVLSQELKTKGHKCAALHGDLNQSRRTQTVTKMKKGKIQLLIATDVASRGLDIQDISHVINFDLPRTVEDYIHRIGRTGRAGAKGAALSFVTEKDRAIWSQIERWLDPKDSDIQKPIFPRKEFKKQKPKKASRGFLHKKYRNNRKLPRR